MEYFLSLSLPCAFSKERQSRIKKDRIAAGLTDEEKMEKERKEKSFFLFQPNRR